MRRAILKVTGTDYHATQDPLAPPKHLTVNITLFWLESPFVPRWVPGLGIMEKIRTIRTWSCLPGYLGADQGYWTEHPLMQRIELHDEDDEEIAWANGTKISWIGYPFDGLKGASGFFYKTHKGGALPGHASRWELLEV
jgi:hypothetical protein